MPSHDDIAQIAQWLATTDIASLELRAPEGIVRLERRSGAFEVSSIAGANASETTPTSEQLSICAGTPGIFLHSHPLHDHPLVEVGAVVHSDQIVGLLRVGAVLVPVRAPCEGRIDGYWTEDGASVGYGAPLIALSETRP